MNDSTDFSEHMHNLTSYIKCVSYARAIEGRFSRLRLAVEFSRSKPFLAR